LAYELTRSFPQSELYELTSQIRRCATSVAANIAEGWARRYPAEFVQFLRRANGSLAELETHLTISADVGLLHADGLESLLAGTQLLGRQLLSLERSVARRSATRES
jgi:four helix bundle protein